MFSNDLVIPKNFVSLETYKTKTNPQTTTFCDKLCVDDPLALLLGKWPRSSLSHSEQEMNSTFSSFVNSTVCSNNENESIDNTPEKLTMSPFILPEPKNNDTTYIDAEKNVSSNNGFSSFNLSNTSEELANEVSTETNHQSPGKFHLHQ